MFLLIAFLGGFFNAVRGGQWRIWLGLDEEKTKLINSDVINALAFGILAMALTGDIYLGLHAAVGMMLGASSGWGDYIGALGGWRKDNLKENRFIDFLIYPLRRWPLIWGAAGLTIRGAWWGFCLASPFWWHGHQEVGLQFLIHGLYFAPAYWLAIEWMRTRIKQPGEGWGLGEIFAGIALWAPLTGLI